MAEINVYATLAEFKSWIKTSGSGEDAVIVDILEAVSRHIDNETSRTFYPRVQTRSFDTPSGRELAVDDDLLEIITLTNGDDNTIASTEYNVLPSNIYPKGSIKLKASSSTYWQLDSSGNSEAVIGLLALWGYHNQYDDRAWSTGSTLNESGTLSAADLTWTMTDGTPFGAGQIIKIENELAIVASVSTNDVVVVARGENGATAATHDDATAVTIWNPQHDIRQACLMIANNLYKKRFGESTSSVARVTGAGVVIMPQDVPSHAARILRGYNRWL